MGNGERMPQPGGVTENKNSVPQPETWTGDTGAIAPGPQPETWYGNGPAMQMPDQAMGNWTTEPQLANWMENGTIALQPDDARERGAAWPQPETWMEHRTVTPQPQAGYMAPDDTGKPEPSWIENGREPGCGDEADGYSKQSNMPWRQDMENEKIEQYLKNNPRK